MASFDIKAVAFECFVNLAIKKGLTTSKKINKYFSINTGNKLLKGEFWHHETNEYTKMTAKMIFDNLPKYVPDEDSDD